MDLDPTLAYTALLELWPGFKGSTVGKWTRDLIADLAAAMTEANPPDRWEFARGWIAARRQLEAKLDDDDQHPGTRFCHDGPVITCPDHDALSRVWQLATNWRHLAGITPAVQITDASAWLNGAAEIIEGTITGWPAEPEPAEAAATGGP